MQFVHIQSLDTTRRSLSDKKREAIQRLKKGTGYNAYVLKANGDLLKYEVSDNEQGYTLRILKQGQYVLLGR